MPNLDNYHLVFTKNDGTEIGVNLCDNSGVVTPRAIQTNPMSRLAIKMAQGGTKHSDWEPPYTPTEQRDMSSGRALKYHEDDKTRFLDSQNMDTTAEGHVFLGPRARYTLGPRTGTQWVPGSIEWKGLYGDTRALDIPFTPDATYDAKEIWLWLKYVGTPEDLQIEIYTDSGDDPSVSQETQTIDYSTADTILGGAVKITMDSATSVTVDIKYHIVVNGSVKDDADNHWLIGYDRRAAREVQYTNTGGWNATTWGVYYRVMEEENEGKPHFFTYKNAFFMGFAYDGGVDVLSASDPSKVFINGEQGIVTGGNKYVIEDDTKSWATDEHKDSILIMARGSVSSSDPRWSKIESNNGTSIVLSRPLASSFDADIETLVYVIVGSDRWTEITGHGMRGAITDVLAANSIAYFCMGDDERMIRMRRLVGGAAMDTWTNEWEDEDIKGTFVEMAPDSNGVPQIWVGNHRVPSKVWRADPIRGKGGTAINNLSFDQDNLVTNSSMSTNTDWSDVGTPTTNEQSSTKVFGGGNSWKVVTDEIDEGMQQSITTETDERYIATCVVYADTIPTNGEIEFRCDGNLIRQTPDSYQVDYGEWAYLKGVFVASGTATSVQITATAAASTFYVDEVEVYKMPTPVDQTGEERITNLISYGEPERLYALTDAGIYMESNGYFLKLPLREYSAVQDDRNGRQALVHDVYLYVTLLDGLERYYRSNLDDMGPNRDEGLPANRRGEISFLAGYPPRIYAGIDAGDNGYSCVLTYNGLGWHELYRAPLGERVRGGRVQALPGDEPDRLWFGQGSDVMWLPVVLNPTQRLED